MHTLRLRRISRYRWPLVITASLVMTAVFSLSPLVDINDHGAAAKEILRTSLAYDVVAPFSNVLDALTLLTPAQDVAMFALCAVVALGLWIGTRGRRRAGVVPCGLPRTALCFCGGAVAITGIMLIAVRPMASLALADPDLIAVDFHSHTDASHDGRPGFDPESNREWHSSSGFNAVYVTDHRTFDGALDGLARNPERAGERTVLLPGVELRDGDQHPILLGVDPKRMRITSPDWKGAAVEADGGPAAPILLLSLPGNIGRIPASETDGPVRIAGVEAIDGSPRGMAQSARDQNAVIALAQARHLALVSASDNHGWGRTSPAWSVLRIPGWRDMTPSELDIAIRLTIISQGPRAVKVIARRTVPSPRNRLEMAAGGIAVALVMMRTMNVADRLSWVAWSWGLCFLSLRSARRNANKSRARLKKRTVRKLRPAIDVAA
ncbi:MAG: PHP domain-containing protein [Gemmatimonadaceae bacterium]